MPADDMPLSPLRVAMLKATGSAVMRMGCDRPNLLGDPRPIPCDDAFSIITQLQDFHRHELWRGNKLSYAGGHSKMALAVTHLGDAWTCRHLSPFDNIRFHIPRGALDTLTQELGRPRITGFDCPSGTADPVVHHLAAALLPALDHPGQASTLFIDQVMLAVTTHVAQAYGGMVIPMRQRQRGGLSRWQEIRAKEILAACHDGTISIGDVAQECNLSRSYFIKAFKQTTGQTPHQWLLHHRVARARELLVGPLSIAEIAVACGFADQSHLTRVFTATMGLPPAAWRRHHRL